MQSIESNKNMHIWMGHFFLSLLQWRRLGVFGAEARALFRDIARRITTVTQDPLSHQYLVQRVAVVVQRGNAAAVLGTMSGGDDHIGCVS